MRIPRRAAFYCIILENDDSNNVVLSNEHEQFLWVTKDEAMELLPQPIIEDFTQHQLFERLF